MNPASSQTSASADPFANFGSLPFFPSSPQAQIQGTPTHPSTPLFSQPRQANDVEPTHFALNTNHPQNNQAERRPSQVKPTDQEATPSTPLGTVQETGAPHGTSASAEDTFSYHTQLTDLEQMGFSNRNANKRALLLSGGNIHSAVEWLLQQESLGN
jgi:ubiquilin